jgi:uncharacterized protein (TIGR02145 family)
MKKLFYILTILAFGFTQAQPQKINYQAVALTAGGQTVKNQAIKLRLSIVDSSATGTVLYTETHQPTTDGAGQFSVFLGGGTATVGTFSNVAWSNGKDKFLKAEADVTGGTNYVLMGTSQIVSVPYAIAAGSLKDSAKVISQDGTQWSLIVGPNGPTWQQSSGPGGSTMNYPCPGLSSVVHGGETYYPIMIGNQCWINKNINVGTITQGYQNPFNGQIEKICYGNNPVNCGIYGGLYTWEEANYSAGICPSGFHIPSESEFLLLFSAIGGGGNAALLKSQNTWIGILGNNLSGFDALAAGTFQNNTSLSFWNVNYESGFWTSTNKVAGIGQNGQASAFILNHSILLGNAVKSNGYSVRCLKD